MASARSEARSSWPPTCWEVRLVVGDDVRVFHVNEEGFMLEPLHVGDVFLVEPPGPGGYRSTGFTTAFTRLAAKLSGFDNCCIRVVDALDGTAQIGTYDGELAFGSDGAFGIPFPLTAAPTSARE